MPTMIAMGVASPSAQGQLMTSTATAVVSEKYTSCVQSSQKHPAPIAIISTAGTKMPLNPAIVRNVALQLQKKVQNFALCGAFEFGGKPNLVLMYSNDLVAKGKNAGKDIREAAALIQGGGGGQPSLATAGGRLIDGLAAALNKLVDIATR